MIEDEAKKLWCPFARVAVPSGHVNRIRTATKDMLAKPGNERDREWHVQQERDTFCIGSACMAWRKTYNTSPVREPIEDGGYCGLAGPP